MKTEGILKKDVVYYVVCPVFVKNAVFSGLKFAILQKSFIFVCDSDFKIFF